MPTATAVAKVLSRNKSKIQHGIGVSQFSADKQEEQNDSCKQGPEDSGVCPAELVRLNNCKHHTQQTGGRQ